MATDGIGASVRRKEDFRFITGRGRYTDDLDRPGQAYAYFVRSPHAHAEIEAIDTSAAMALPGVLAIYTAADIAADGLGTLGLFVFVKDHNGKPLIQPPRTLLAEGRVRHAGDPYAMIVADSIAVAKDAAERLHTEFRPLPAIASGAAAVAPDAPRIWDEAPGNVAIDRAYGNADAVDAAFAEAAHIARLDFVNNRVCYSAMEPRAAIGEYDSIEDRYTGIVSNQGPHVLQVMLAEDVFHMPEHHIRILSYDVGGGFGPKGCCYPEEALVMWAAKKVGRAVKWTGERAEAFLGDAHSRDHATHAELALDAEGNFLAMRIDDVANLGAYVSTYGPAPACIPQSLLAVGAYTMPAAAGRVRAVFSNTVPTDAYRGAGRPETAYMVERLVDVAAQDMGMDKAEIRRRNLIPAARMPYQSPLGPTYDSGDFPGTFQRALDAGDRDGFAARRIDAAARGKLLGIGLASYIEVNGLGPSDIAFARGQRFGSWEPAQIRFNTSGGVTILTGTHSHGQGLDTAFAQLVAEGLGVPVDDVECIHGDTATIPFGRGTVGSRSMMVGGGAIKLAVDKVVEKGKKIAAHMLEAAPADIEFTDGVFAVAGTDREVGIKEVARTAYYPADYPLGELEPGLDEVAYFDPTNAAFPFGAHVCEVEVDPETGIVRITRYTAVDDFGTVINPMLVEGQVHGGIVQGIGQAMLEIGAFDPDSAQLLTGSFMDYCMPRADDLPNFETAEDGHPCPTNPLGVKGCGEAGAVGAPPALINAIVDALAGLGVRHVDMPATPEAVWRAIQSAQQQA